MKKDTIVTAENFRCPNCDIRFTEEDLMSLCSEPFNGVIITCEKCKKEFSADIVINLRRIE